MPRPARGQSSSIIVQAARGQRRQATPMEQRLWDEVRDRRLAGLKFRRQHPYGPFILDAFCVKHLLEVEVDGPVHDDPPQADHDAARTEYLERRGIRVLRFTNDEVEHDLPGVLRRIVAATREP
jgi:very-short-patch-repair endonuclease